MLRGALVPLLFIGLHSIASEQDPEVGERDSIRRSLDSIRDDLVDLRFESALAAIEALVGASSMSETEQAELLVLRSQAHVAFGDLEAAEEDFREILHVRPGFEPDASLTPRKALDRFRKIQAATVGRLSLRVDPADARLFVDGREAGGLPGHEMFLLAGEHEIRVEQAGFDPSTQTVEIAPGKTETIEIQLVPNSRTIVLRTEPDGVEILLDGEVVGWSERLAGSVSPTGELVIVNVPLGEHELALRKECFRNEIIRDSLTVNLLDRGPKRFNVVVMEPVRSTVVLSGGPPGATVDVDGSPVGRLPIEPFEVCPGTRTIDVRSRGRLLWRETRETFESTQVELDVVPRPNLVLIGAQSWPAELEDYAKRFNRLDGIPLPGSVDLATADGWRGVGLAGGTDLALAVVPSGRAGLRERWYLYSPILRTVHLVDGLPRTLSRPQWRRPAWGLSVVDSDRVGAALVIDVPDGGAAATAGVAVGGRLTAVGGREVNSAVEVRSLLAAVGADLTAAVAWVAPDGQQREGTLQGDWTPWVELAYESADQAMELAAWALVDSLADPPRAPAALSNLALLFSRFGHHELAVETWRRVRWGERSGIGEGTVQYYLAHDLERLGREEDAKRAYRRAAASLSTAVDDEGPLVAPAARDRLADLGVTD